MQKINYRKENGSETNKMFYTGKLIGHNADLFTDGVISRSAFSRATSR